MAVHTHTLERDSTAEMDIFDITADVREAVAASGMKDGVATVFVPGSTGAVTTVEYEPGLVEDLTEFFDRFRQLNVRSNEDLDTLVEQCQGVIRGVEPQSLRDNQDLRQTVAGELSQVQTVLDDLLVPSEFARHRPGVVLVVPEIRARRLEFTTRFLAQL